MNIASRSLSRSGGVGLLLLGLATMGAKDGCGPIDPDPSDGDQCLAPADCEGLPHVLCLGAWQCLDGACQWQCSQPGSECTVDADCAGKPAPIRCPGTWFCLQGTCQYQCTEEPPAGCQKDSDCPEGMHCETKEVCPPCVEAAIPCLAPCEVQGTCVEDQQPPPTCVTGGCSGELCVPEGSDIASPCWYLDWFACLKYSRCGNFGANGSCGWEATPEFEKCLQNLQCSGDQACPEGYACLEGRCVKPEEPPAGCYSDENCPKGTHCSVRDGECLTDPNCPVCDVCYGRCVPDQEPLYCDDDNQCPRGMTCVQKTECPPCVYENPPCRAPCRVYAVCEWAPEPGQCRTDEDCKPGERCYWTGLCPPCDCDPAAGPDCLCECPMADHGICGPACDPSSPEVCGNGLDDDCDGQVDEDCRPPVTCLQDSDCMPYEFCDLGQPVYGPDGTLACCPPNARCTSDIPPCGSGVCRLQPGYCWTDGDCLPGQRCEGAIVCPPGAYCFVADQPGKCVTDSYIPCTGDSSCPKGYVCDTTQCLSCCPNASPDMGCIAMCCGQCVPGGGCIDQDGDGYCVETDCNDADPGVFPGALEVCDGLDNDCNGMVDEACGGCQSDKDCGPNEVCVFPDYAADGSLSCCPPNAFCIPEIPPCPLVGQCVPVVPDPAKCRSDADCGEGLRCIIELTYPMTCCPPGEICIMIYPPCEGTCRLQVDRCWTDRDCQAGQTCVGARICPPGALCLLPDAPGKCEDPVLPVRCDPSGSCPDGMACTTATVCPPCVNQTPPCEMPCQEVPVCKRVCQTDADCRDSEFCNAVRCGGTRCPGPWFCEPR